MPVGIWTDIEELARRINLPAEEVADLIRQFSGDTQSFVDNLVDRMPFYDDMVMRELLEGYENGRERYGA